MNKHKQFIKDAYNGKYGSMCSDWKETILEHYPEFKPKKKFKVGDWITPFNDYEGIALLNIQNELGSRNSGYGIDYEGKWCDSNYSTEGSSNEYSYRRATKEEVETALIAEAKRRGFKKGVTYKSVFEGDPNITISWYEPSLRDDCSLKAGHANGIIFKDGKWAEIIPTMTKAEAEKELNCKIV